MCNLSENIGSRAIETGMKQGIETERLNAGRRMLQPGVAKGGYTEEEFVKAQELV